jgi:hypothetical protein
MYVILTSKVGKFRTELAEGLRPFEAYDYFFYGQKLAHFVIAELTMDTKITVVDEDFPPTVNHVPSKFFERFETVERARAELFHLTTFGHMDTALQKI